MADVDRPQQAFAAQGAWHARRNILLLMPLLLFAACGAAAQAPTSKWSAWQSAMAPDGSAHPAVQFRWRSSSPCTEVGCRLGVQIRNVSHAPLRLHCFIYIDPPPEPYEDEVRPVILDTVLKASGDHTGKRKTGDTTSPLIIPGVRITGVVVDSKPN